MNNKKGEIVEEGTPRSELLKLSVLDLIILQRLTFIRKPLIRYQLMQEIRNVVGRDQFSTATFYYTLDRLHDNNLVNFSMVDNSQRDYFITKKGITTLYQSRTMINQLTDSLFAYLGDQMPNIREFAGVGAEVVLLVDFIMIIDVNIVSEAVEHSSEVHLLTSDDSFKWFKVNILELVQTNYSGGIIREPDSFFDLIFAMNTSQVDDNRIFSEFFRVLKPGGKLLLLEIENPIASLDHFLVDVMLANILPLLRGLKDHTRMFDEIENEFDWSETTTLEWRGLYAKRFVKA